MKLAIYLIVLLAYIRGVYSVCNKTVLNACDNDFRAHILRLLDPNLKHMDCSYVATYIACMRPAIGTCPSEYIEFVQMAVDQFNTQFVCNFTLNESACDKVTISICAEEFSSKMLNMSNGITSTDVCSVAMKYKACLRPVITTCPREEKAILKASYDQVNEQYMCNFTMIDRDSSCNDRACQVCADKFNDKVFQDNNITDNICGYMATYLTCSRPLLDKCEEKKVMSMERTVEDFNSKHRCGFTLRKSECDNVTTTVCAAEFQEQLLGVNERDKSVADGKVCSLAKAYSSCLGSTIKKCPKYQKQMFEDGLSKLYTQYKCTVAKGKGTGKGTAVTATVFAVVMTTIAGLKLN